MLAPFLIDCARRIASREPPTGHGGTGGHRSCSSTRGPPFTSRMNAPLGGDTWAIVCLYKCLTCSPGSFTIGTHFECFSKLIDSPSYRHILFFSNFSWSFKYLHDNYYYRRYFMILCLRKNLTMFFDLFFLDNNDDKWHFLQVS